MRQTKGVLFPVIHALLLSLLFSLSASPYSYAAGKITGRVTDRQTGEALIGANVFIRELAVGARTDNDGEYVIINVPPGTYNLTASFIGYESVTQTGINVISNRTVQASFRLSSSSLSKQEVVVAAEKPPVEKDLTASEQIIDDKNISRSFANTVPQLLETQTGIFQGYYRSSTQVQALYMLDNVSMNSGLFSENYTGINTSTIQEIAVLTGGYNAEFGNARAAIVNVTTKTSKQGLKGTVLFRMRPSGLYHFGRNMFSQENYDWKHFDLNYWKDQVSDPNSAHYGKNAEELFSLWRKQITPNDTLKNYDKQIEYETEATLYGPVTENINFLVSGRYARHVNIYPQPLPDNPEFNFQGHLEYRISPKLTAKITGLFGGYESCQSLSTNWNSTESAQEAQWYAQMEVTRPYQQEKYALLGAFLYQWPEKRRWTQMSGKITYIFSPETFLETSLNYLNDNMDRSDRYGIVPDSMYSHRDDTQKLIYFLDRGYQRAWDKTDSKVYMIKSDLVSQVTKNHLVKTGFEFKSYDFNEDHFMVEYKGGGRENFVNKFQGYPYEGSVYVQDKMEFPGMVVNAGVRLDYFNQNRMAPKSMFDPLAFELTTPGHNPNEPYGFPGNPEREKTKLQLAVSPRLGISHPISENTVLHFVYGHFYQRPSWSKMFGFPTVSYTENDSAAQNQYGDQKTFMEEWHGYLGNPELTFEKTIQYEIGIDHNIAGLLKLDVTGYYKDASQETGFNAITGVYPATHYANKPLMVSNAGYSDTRGLESKIETKLDFYLNGGISHDIYWAWDGVVGYSRLYEPGADREDVPKGLRNDKSTWSSYHKIKAWANLNFPENFGPEIFGVKPLSDLYTYVYFWWRSGTPYTYHGPGDISTRPNNKRWFNYYQINLKVAKGFTIYGKRIEFSLDVENLLNSKFYRLLYGDDMIRWQERKDLSERDRLPKNSFSNEPNEWNWYSYEVPPRKMYFQVRLDF